LISCLPGRGLAKTAIEKIAVSIGPGSFTGLRIGLAAAEAMAYAWHCPICGVNTLKALAYNIPVPGLALLTLLDAQKGNYYRGCYTWQAGKLVEVQPIAIVSGQQILAEAAASGNTGTAVRRMQQASSVALACEGDSGAGAGAAAQGQFRGVSVPGPGLRPGRGFV
jgi:tRNA threonylcarbamoyl adenosine modification protein YeaZ